MAGYFIAEEGPLSGLVVRLEDGSEWVLGRNPDEADIALEDPMVSRKHVICRLTPEGYVLENLSSVNPATQNGKIITEPVLLHENDTIQIGSTFFRFTEHAPREGTESASPTFVEESHELPTLTISPPQETRWLLKVISGPNSGAEFNMQKGSSYVMGKDPAICDIVFQDLSVSRQHARISVDDQENVFIEDLGSLNGTLVNGGVIAEKKLLASQDLISMGTTSFMVIDREKAFQTIVSEPIPMPYKKEGAVAEETPSVNWREMVIPKKHLVVAGILGTIVLFSIIGIFSLFTGEAVAIDTKDEGSRISEIVKHYPDVQFSYNNGSGKLFLSGHVLTAIEAQELLYQLKGLPFLSNIEQTVVIDAYVWQNMNALLATNPDWQGIAIHSPTPGRFVMRGYLQSADQAQALADYVTMNFPYLDRLENQVVIESTLMTQIQSILIEKGFNNVSYQVTNGELVLSGRVDGKEEHSFEKIVKELKGLMGIRSLKNYVIYTSEDTSLVDLSSKYKVMGFSKKDGANHYVVIGGRILTIGDMLDGMKVINIAPTMVVLEKDGLKFKINYNLQ